MGNGMHVFDAGGGRLSSVLGLLAMRDPDRAALVFLEDGEVEAGRLTRAQMHLQAMRVAESLRERGLVGERVLLAFHSSIDYVVAFLGCLYAGVIAVPVYPPRQNWHSRRLVAIARDAGAGLVLTSDALCAEVRERLNAADGVSLDTLGLGALSADAGEGWINEAVRPDELAYLQYTSGSTGDPKGVMITHTNLATNAQFIAQSAGLQGGTSFVSWLPIYHDMGLVAGIVLPLMLGATAVFMPPAAFVQQPLCWLKAIDTYRGEFSAAPNFAFDLCVARVSAEQAAQLDLSSWRVALNGAEPIWASTIDAFNERFAASRANPALTSGGYGMAEATLVVTIGALDELSPRLVVDKTALAADRIVLAGPQAEGTSTFVSSGHVRPGFEVCIVRPQDGKPCEAFEVGEIWVAGPCVGGGYWQRPEATEETFRARVPGRPGVHWLRTGDLGFVHEGQLYVTGRLKDLIIVRGANHYPQDLERTAEQAHPALRLGGYSAAFTVDDGSAHPRVVIVQEVERSARKTVDVAVAGRAVADAVAREHGIEVDMVVLVPPATVPKTSSGKIQRRACRASMLGGELSEIGRWERPVAKAAPSQPPQQWTQWLCERVAALTGRAEAEVSPQKPFSDMGLDSVRVVELVADLSRAAGAKLPASLLFDHPTIAQLSAHLAGGRGVAQAASVDRAMPIAIVGMDCRVPGADGLEAFWQLLQDGRVATGEVPAERAALTGWQPAPDAPHRFAGVIDDVAGFDAAAFGIAPREAQSMDPQQRLLLETAWHALERAHIAPDRLAGSATGVFVGISTNDYYRLQRANGAGLDGHAGTGGALCIAANRVSYALGLQGPSMAIDTACSSSLVAIHQACRSLAAGECDLALAGGVNLVLCEDLGTIFGRAGMLAPDGRCKTFDDGADGYVRGEGCGVLVLKRLDDALRDGDTVRAVIAGSAVNQDGASNGLTAPNGLAQQRVVQAALQRAGIEGAAIDYVETHGTGTSLGDPVEVHALREVLDAPAATAVAPCWLGAVKTQIGHLEAAAGVMGVIKATLALQHQAIPANCNFTRLNSKIHLDGSRLRPVTAAAAAWPAHSGHVRRAGVSSFGFGGTNAHLVLEEAPAVQPAQLQAPAATLHVLSAHTPEALRDLAGRHAAVLAQADGDAAVLLSQAARGGRAALGERLAVCAANPAEAAKGLHAYAEGAAAPAGVSITSRHAQAGLQPAFLFTGQGAQYAGMGAGLYRSEPAFRRMIDRCDAVLRPELGVALQELMWGEATERLADTRYAQPALVALQLGLVAIWAERGVRPAWVCGHSVGEYAAAVASGLMEVEAALKLVVLRAKLMSAAPLEGGMLSVGAGEQQALLALAALAGTLEVAACNSARQTVLSGEASAVEAAVARLQSQGLAAKRLAVSHAFHSKLMDPVLPAFEPAVSACRFGELAVPFVSTGGQVGADVRQPGYWVEQVRKPVRFADAVAHLRDAGARAFIEIGPGSTLLSLLREPAADGVERIASLQRDMDAALAWQSAVGAWWAAGGAVQWPRPSVPSVAGAVELPVYPFERRHHWFERGAVSVPVVAGAGLVGQRIDLADDSLQVFDAQLPGAASSWLCDHVVAGQPVMPAAGWVSLALQAMAGVSQAAVLSGLQFDQPLALAQPTRVQTRLLQEGEGWALRISKQVPGQAAWVDCTRGRWLPAAPQGAAVLQLAQPAGRPLDVAALYARLASAGLAYGPAFQLLGEVALGEDEVQASVRPPQDASAAVGTAPHPAWLDSVFQALGAALVDEAERRSQAPVPVAIDRLQWAGRAVEGIAQVQARLRSRDGQGVLADLVVTDASGAWLLQVEGLRLRWVSTLAAAADPLSYVMAWDALELAAAPAGRWAVLADSEAVARRVAADLQQGGAVASVLACDGMQATAVQSAMLQALQHHADTRFLVAVADSGAEGEEAIDLALAHCRGLQAVLGACEAVAARHPAVSLSLLTEQALPGPGCAAPSIATAAVAAAWRSAAQELPALALRHVDRAPASSAADAQALVQALGSDETECRVHAGRAHARRLVQAATPASMALKPTATGAVLVTGGAGALGLQVAQWLVEQGTRHLCLVSRQPRLDAQGEARVQAWRGQGIRVDLKPCDLARRDQAQALLDGLSAEGTALRGIVHAAGVLSDTPLAALDETRWRAPVDGKVRGALWLDALTRHLPLAFFVGFSSAAAPLGSPGQCNYAAANAMLEAVLQQRAAALPASATRLVSVQWGPWGGAGMAASEPVRQALARRGLAPLEPAEALQALGHAMAGTAGTVLVARVDWPQLASAGPVLRASALRTLVQPAAAGAPESERPDAEALLAMDKPEALAAIRIELAAQLAQVLKLDASQLPAHDPSRFDHLRLSSLGLDSLMAMEMRNRMRGWLGVDLPAHVLIGGVEVAEVLELIHEKALLRSLSAPAPAVADTGEATDDDMEVMVL